MNTKQKLQGEIEDLKKQNMVLSQENTELKRDNLQYKKDNLQYKKENLQYKKDNAELLKGNASLIGILERSNCQAPQVHHYHKGAQTTIHNNTHSKK